MEMEGKEVFAIRVTREEREALEYFMHFNEWDIERVNLEGADRNEGASNNEDVPVQPEVPVEPQPIVQPIPGTDECQFCFCQPCVTTRRQQWLGQGRPPMAGNNLLRKKKYKNFWTMMTRRGAWTHPRYLHKKAAAQGADENNVAWLPEVRDIMPDCVLNLVRGLYPNEKGIPYMGHKWI
jgi:hypothetical protein